MEYASTLRPPPRSEIVLRGEFHFYYALLQAGTDVRAGYDGSMLGWHTFDFTSNGLESSNLTRSAAFPYTSSTTERFSAEGVDWMKCVALMVHFRRLNMKESYVVLPRTMCSQLEGRERELRVVHILGHLRRTSINRSRRTLFLGFSDR